MKTKQMIIAGAILIALATLWLIGATKMSNRVVNGETSTKYIEQMGEKYGKIEF